MNFNKTLQKHVPPRSGSEDRGLKVTVTEYIFRNVVTDVHNIDVNDIRCKNRNSYGATFDSVLAGRIEIQAATAAMNE